MLSPSTRLTSSLSPWVPWTFHALDVVHAIGIVNSFQVPGLCNGSRGILTRVSSRVLEIRLIGGDHRGKTAFIPRITLTPSEKQVGICMKRCQFPVRLAFSMTINKAQGQSVDYVGLDLRTDVFAHGQLYVALSRCTSSHRVKALFNPDNYDSCITKNVVYKEVST